MSTDIDRALEAANWPVDLAASVRDLVASLQPGEVLRYNEDGELAYYERAAADGRSIDAVWLDGNIFTETASAAIRPELKAMIARGELAEGPGCSEWHRPVS